MKEARFEIRFTEAEKELFNKCAGQAHLSLAAWIRVTLHACADGGEHQTFTLPIPVDNPAGYTVEENKKTKLTGIERRGPDSDENEYKTTAKHWVAQDSETKRRLAAFISARGREPDNILEWQYFLKRG